MRENSAVSKVQGTILERSEKALHMEVDTIADIPVDEAPVKTWFPLSQIDKIMSTKNAGEDSFLASNWILEKKGFI